MLVKNLRDVGSMSLTRVQAVLVQGIIIETKCSEQSHFA